MKEGSLELIRVRGIAIRLHFTFPIILILVAIQYGILSGFSGQAIINGIFVTLLLFVLVVLHELGHGWVAQHYGIEVKEIILFPLGGMASLAENPREPRQEMAIAAAGPIVNFVLALLLLVPGILFARFYNFDLQFSIRYDFLDLHPGAVLGYLITASFVLAAFNLFPSFPLDGGRILRAILASRLEYESATRLAGTLGQMTAAMIGLWGFLQGQYLLTIIAIGLFLISREEELNSGFQEQVDAVTVEQIINRDYIPLESYDTIKEAIDLVITADQRATPILEHNFYLGMLTQKRLIKAIEAKEFYRFAFKFIRTDIEVAGLQDRVVDIYPRLSIDDVDVVPVVENGRYLGVVTIRDASRVMALKIKQPSAVQKAG